METEIMSTITNNLIKTVWTSNIFSKKKNMGTLLDPINTAISLSMLNFYPDGTKISIQNNEIIFQEPTGYQGISRWKNGDSYEDIHNLVNPIKKLLTTKQNLELWGKTNFEYLCNMMKLGLAKLAKTYKENQIANHTIEFYQSLISENMQDKTHFLEKLDTEPEDMKERRLSDGKYAYDIYQDFFDDWDNKQVDVIVLLLKNMESEQKEEIRRAYKDGLHLVIGGHNERVKTMIDKVKSGMI
jgi:hypothetical protein